MRGVSKHPISRPGEIGERGWISPFYGFLSITERPWVSHDDMEPARWSGFSIQPTPWLGLAKRLANRQGGNAAQDRRRPLLLIR